MGGNYNHYFTPADYTETVYFADGKTTLSDDEIALGINTLVNALKNVYYNDKDVCEQLDNMTLDKANTDVIKSAIKPLVEGAKIKMSCGGSISPYLEKTYL